MVKRLEFEAVIFILFGIVAGFLVLSYTKHTPIQLHSDAATPFHIAVAPTETPTPTPTYIPTTETASQISPDGTKKVVVTATKYRDNSHAYAISVDDEPSFYTATLSATEKLTIPFNTWSASNRYFFLQEQTNAGPKVLVFQATGEPFSNGQQYLDLTGTFEARTAESGNTFDQATGWAEGNLIIINTKRDDGTQGTSYWYEVPSEGLIPLSTKF